jgi:hypothetical protein
VTDEKPAKCHVETAKTVNAFAERLLVKFNELRNPEEQERKVEVWMENGKLCYRMQLPATLIAARLRSGHFKIVNGEMVPQTVYSDKD